MLTDLLAHASADAWQTGLDLAAVVVWLTFAAAFFAIGIAAKARGLIR